MPCGLALLAPRPLRWGGLGRMATRKEQRMRWVDKLKLRVESLLGRLRVGGKAGRQGRCTVGTFVGTTTRH